MTNFKHQHPTPIQTDRDGCYWLMGVLSTSHLSAPLAAELATEVNIADQMISHTDEILSADDRDPIPFPYAQTIQLGLIYYHQRHELGVLSTEFTKTDLGFEQPDAISRLHGDLKKIIDNGLQLTENVRATKPEKLNLFNYLNPFKKEPKELSDPRLRFISNLSDAIGNSQNRGYTIECGKKFVEKIQQNMVPKPQ